jgi:NADH dehydrogenase
MNAPRPHRVVVVGGGFGGLRVCQALRAAPVEVTLLDRRNFHLFQPLLYQVATGALSPGDIASPLRGVLRRQRNTRVWMAEATGFDVRRRRVLLADGVVEYDTLVVAAGSGYQYFGRDDWQPLAPSLKSVEEALEIRGRVLGAFEAAERETDPRTRTAWLTFVIVGAGPTGVELAGALAEVARDTLRHDFRVTDPTAARVVLVEGGGCVLPAFPPDLSEKAAAALERVGVEVRPATTVVQIDVDGVTLRRATGEEERLPARVVLWAAGVSAAPLAGMLATATGAERDRSGRVLVDPDLTVPGHSEIFVIGDMAHVRREGGPPLPGLAPVALQQGEYVARVIRARLAGGGVEPFRYRDRGVMATIGRGAAVANLGRVRLSGLPAWLAWLFVHLINLVEFENRVLVLVQWAWMYLTWNRSARLITGGGEPESRRADAGAAATTHQRQSA